MIAIYHRSFIFHHPVFLLSSGTPIYHPVLLFIKTTVAFSRFL